MKKILEHLGVRAAPREEIGAAETAHHLPGGERAIVISLAGCGNSSPMPFVDRRRLHGRRLVLQAIDRVQRILATQGPDFAEAAVWEALEHGPLPRLPGVVEAWLSPPDDRFERPSGTVFTVKSRFLGTDAGRAYRAILFPSGAVAVGFPPDVEPEVSSIFNRFAAGRLFAENGRRFPQDLLAPEAFASLLCLLGLPEIAPPPPAPIGDDTGEVDAGPVRIAFEPRRLWVRAR